jgi:hypothetical protein
LHPSDALNFARLAREFKEWRAVSAEERSDAPGWWWGSAMAVRHSATPLPEDLCMAFAADRPLTYSDGAELVRYELRVQEMLAWPVDFPRKREEASPAAASDAAAQAAASAIPPV